MSWVDKFKRRVRAADTPKGPLPSGGFNSIYGIDASVFLVIDNLGRVHQIEGKATISGATLRRVKNPRSELVKLLDRFGVEDGIDVPEEKPDAKDI